MIQAVTEKNSDSSRSTFWRTKGQKISEMTRSSKGTRKENLKATKTRVGPNHNTA